MDFKSLNWAIKQIADEKGIEPEKVFEAVESAIAAAYKKEYCKRGEIIHAKMDPKIGALNFWKTKTVVDETTVRMEEEEENPEITPTQSRSFDRSFGRDGKLSARGGYAFGGEIKDDEEKLPRYNPDRHILLEEAKQIKSDAVLEEEIIFPLEEQEDFGRIAAQTAKQVIIQKLREEERMSVQKEFQDKEGQIISGIVQRIERGNVFVDLGRAAGIMFFNETIPGEYYRVGERLKFYLLAVQQEEGKKPGIILSRSHPQFVAKLFEIEVPEIADGMVEIKEIAREAGSRTKVAVASKEEGIDPVGACVGQRGTRVMAVTNELGNEKIDIIEWHEQVDKFLAASLSPAKAKEVEILPRREAKVFVPEDQLSLAIGKDGQNVRLAAMLTGWKIDIRSQSRPDQVQEGGIANVAETSVATEEISEEQAEQADKKVEENKESE